MSRCTSVLQLITYRETALLIDPKFSSMDTKQRVAIVVAHELAHQWFGNLVVGTWLLLVLETISQACASHLDDGLVDRSM